ncbi:MAG: alkane 1-monooxygenase [Saprospiraceae bacterium]
MIYEMLKPWKYVVAYLAPFSAIIGIYFKGWYSPGSMYIGFILIPIIEGLFFKNPAIDFEGEPGPSHSFIHDLFLYFNIPLVYFIVGYYLYTISSYPLHLLEHIALIFNVGLIVGTSGINVAHELGHRKSKIHHWMAWSLLLPALYLHFFIEHNKGHHRYIGTPEDPATARYKESIYSFWIRSIKDSYLHAWYIQQERLRLKRVAFFSIQNTMLWFQLATFIYLALVAILFSWFAMAMAILVGIVGTLFLESVNYIEHYGLRRNKISPGNYEPIHEGLSWDADQPLGRIFLYELTRHADHHTHASKPYQQLQSSELSPKLAYGYPASIVLALIPELWFKIMNPRLAKMPGYQTVL